MDLVKGFLLLFVLGCSDPVLLTTSATPPASARPSSRPKATLALPGVRLGAEPAEVAVQGTLPPAWRVGQRWVVRNDSRRASWFVAESGRVYSGRDHGVEREPSYEYFEVAERNAERALVRVSRRGFSFDLELTFSLAPFFLREAKLMRFRYPQWEQTENKVFFRSDRPAMFDYRIPITDPAPPRASCYGCGPILPYVPAAEDTFLSVHRVEGGVAFWGTQFEPVMFWRAGEPWPSTLLSNRTCELCLVRNADGSVWEPEAMPAPPRWEPPLPSNETPKAPVLPTVPKGVFDPAGPQW